MTCLIRPVQSADAPAITTLINAIIRTGGLTIMTEPFSAADQAAFIAGLPPRSTYLAAVDPLSGALLGVQDVLPLDTGEAALRHVGVISTFVAQASARQGVGSALMRASLAQAHSLGYLKLHATIRADNPAALAFYQAQGFRQAARLEKHAFIQGVFVDEFLFVRWLAG